jgi:hypothetical protein
MLGWVDARLKPGSFTVALRFRFGPEEREPLGAPDGVQILRPPLPPEAGSNRVKSSPQRADQSFIPLDRFIPPGPCYFVGALASSLLGSLPGRVDACGEMGGRARIWAARVGPWWRRNLRRDWSPMWTASSSRKIAGRAAKAWRVRLRRRGWRSRRSRSEAMRCGRARIRAWWDS